MPYLNQAGINVFNQYGARSTGNSVGTDHTQNAVHELSVEITGTSLADSLFVPPYVIPKGVRFLRATLVVDQAFTLTGTTPTVQIGGTAPGTNGLTLSAANLGSVASLDVSAGLAGTWATNSAAGTTAAEKVTIALGGTTPAVTSGVGKASVVMSYIYKHRDLGAVN
jgi:hypothetical protein